MRPRFRRISRFLWWFGFPALIFIIFSIKLLYDNHKTDLHLDAAANVSRNRHNAYVEDFRQTPGIPSITLFVRMAGKLKEHRTRFYCDLFRTAVLFWPASFGKTVVVLDEESVEDHAYGNNLTSQIEQHFPDRKLEVAYESLPNDANILDFKGAQRSPGYSRQLWSSFFIDLYTDDHIIAWVDNDVAFLAPVTNATIFNGSRIRILGSECTMSFPLALNWARVTKRALGLPMLANFMTYFPVYIYRDTFTYCREYILKRFNTSSFEEAFKKIYYGSKFISPVNVVISYAWFFERDRYDWNLKIYSVLKSYNRRLPEGHKITPQDTEDILSQPQTAFHVPYAKEPLSPNIFISYCLSHEAAGNPQAMCSNHSVLLAKNFVLFYHDLHQTTPGKTPCIANKKTEHCLKVLDRHYKQVGLEIREGRKMQWKDFETVETLAKEVDIICEMKAKKKKALIRIYNLW